MMRPVFSIGKGTEKYIKQLESLLDATDDMCKRAVYDGAKIVADELKQEIKRIPTVPENYHGTPEKPINGATNEQIDGLLESMGLAPMDRSGGAINTKLGFDGYNSTVTKKYPKGQPNMLIARSINSGTSFRQKNPFVDRAANRAEIPAEMAMAASLDASITNIMN